MTSEPTAPHILLVDDDEDFLYQHKVQLEHAGYRVTTADHAGPKPRPSPQT